MQGTPSTRRAHPDAKGLGEMKRNKKKIGNNLEPWIRTTKAGQIFKFGVILEVLLFTY